jgi:hypothetical protein
VSETVPSDLEEYQTDMMPLVAYLMHEGFTSQATDFDEDERRCYWIFLITPGLLEKIDMFHKGKGSVEPKTFSAMFHRISRERARFIRR